MNVIELERWRPSEEDPHKLEYVVQRCTSEQIAPAPETGGMTLG